MNYDYNQNYPGWQQQQSVNPQYNQIQGYHNLTRQPQTAGWIISAQEKANFDQTFRAYDPDNTGFIDGLLII